MANEFCVLHLSDIHLKSIDDPIIHLSRDIAQKTYYDARDTGACLIIVSGDIAYSGKANEYEAAEVFLHDIRDALEDEGCSYVDIITVPGNHDCLLLPKDTVREVLIDHVVREGCVDLSTNIVDKCTEAQSAFFTFRRKVTRAQPVFAHPLWSEYEFNFEGTILRVSALNAAWMSRIPEKNGELIFPVDSFQHLLLADCGIRLAVLHHPLHWYAESSFHPLRQLVHSHCDIVLSGHEHSHSTMHSDMALAGQCIFYECGALQPHGNDRSPEFSVIRLDREECRLIQRRFSIHEFTRIESLEEIETSIPKCGGRLTAASTLTEAFQETLRDPGGNFIHPEKAKIYLDDIFIFPDVSDRKSKGKRDFSSERLLKLDDKRKRVLFIADEKAGKTTLLLEAFRQWHMQGYYPVYITALQLKNKKRKDLEYLIREVAKAEYSDIKFFEAAPANKRIILIDDVDELPGGRTDLHPLLEYCDKHYSRIFVTATTGYEFTELLENQAPEVISSFEVFDILNFGHRLRRRLIKKWCSQIAARNNEDLELLVHQVEKVVNTVLGNNLIPAQPIFLLILLQSIHQKQEHELQNSGFAFYYQYLITKGLGSAGVNPNEIDELFNYLSNLSWHFQTTDSREISEIEFRQFNASFSEKYITVDFDKRAKMLVAGKVLVKYGKSFSFSYPYIRYFFIGKYLADHAIDQEVIALVDDYCSTLHLRDRANCLLFLTHHRNDLTVINKITGQLASCFSDYTPLDFDKDTDSLNILIESSTALLLGDIDVEMNQEKARTIKDQFERNNGAIEKEREISLSDTADYALDASKKFNCVIKTAEILGQVLKNYYGSIERSKKLDLLQELFDAPLRMLRFLVEDIITDPEKFSEDLHRYIRKNKPTLAEMPSEKTTREFAFDLIGIICTGVIARTADLANSDKLEEDVANLVAKENSISYRLISAAIKLTQPGRPPIIEIEKLSKDLRNNHFAFSMLQSIGFYYLHMFRIAERDKQKLCSALKINQKDAHMTQDQSRPPRLLPTKLNERH